MIIFSSRIVHPTRKLKIVSKDAADNKIIECAVEANSSFIITGDKHLLDIKRYANIEIMSPKQFFVKR